MPGPRFGINMFILPLVAGIQPGWKIIASGNEAQEIQIWEVASGRLLTTLSGHNDIVSVLAFSRDGQSMYPEL